MCGVINRMERTYILNCLYKSDFERSIKEYFCNLNNYPFYHFSQFVEHSIAT